MPHEQTTSRSSPAPLLRALGPGAAVFLVGVVAFLMVLDGVMDRDDLWLTDQPMVEWFAEHRSDLATTLLTGVTNVFGPVVLPILVAIGCVVWWRLAGQWRDPVLLVGAMLLSTAVSVTIKAVVARPRPDDELMSVPGVESSFSFPSGHTIGATTLVLVSGYLIWERHRSGLRFTLWAVSSVLVVVLVAGSRLYLGYHFITDVLAAISLAVAVLGVVVAFHRWAHLRRVGGEAPSDASADHLDEDRHTHPATD